MDDFSVQSERKGDVTVVTVSGRVDSVTATTLDSNLEKIVRDNSKVVVDLKNVKYISSAGVRAIVKALRNVQKSGGGIRLAEMPPNVLEVLETVGMMNLLQSYPSVDAAIASF